MTWSPQAAVSDQSAKIWPELVPYMHGNALDLGGGFYRVLPHFIGVGTEPFPERQRPGVVVDTLERLGVFGSQQFDCVYSAFHLTKVLDWKATLREWWRMVKPGGHLCLYLPHKDYDKPDKNDITVRHEFLPEDIVAVMREIGGCDLVDCQVRTDVDEYAFWQVYRRLPSRAPFAESWRAPKPVKTCAVVRLGAFGDMLQASSIFAALKREGFHITLYCSAAGHDVVKHDPHVDRFIIQGKDEVPPQVLGEFWAAAAKKYDRWINLSESVECTLLASEGRTNHGWPKEIKAKYMDRNYLEWTHELAGVPGPYEPKFYSTLEERAWARSTAQKMGRRNVLWSLSGSSVHKAWPHLDDVMHRILRQYDDVHIVLVGDEFCRVLQGGWDGYHDGTKFVEKQMNPRVHCRSAKWSIRESMAFAEVADLIIGTETGLLNMAGSLPIGKIVTLSHSSANMLTKHWKNAIALEPVNVKCFPCRQLHFSWKNCWKDEETGTAMCQRNISADQMWAAVTSLLNNERIAA